MYDGVNAALTWLFPLEPDLAAASAPFSHDRGLTALSIALAVLLSYAALSLSARAPSTTGRFAPAWRGGAGAMFGVAAASMHFVGLLALKTPLMHGFAPRLTLISLILPVIAGAAAFAFVGPQARLWRYLLAGGACAIGGVVMHYLGMRALNLEASLTYRLAFVAGTTFGAFLSSIACIWLSNSPRQLLARALLAAPLGAGITLLHFFDMAGAVLTPQPRFMFHQPYHPHAFAWATAICVVAIAGVVIFVSRLRLSPQTPDAVTKAPPSQSDSGDVVVIPTPRDWDHDPKR